MASKGSFVNQEFREQGLGSLRKGSISLYTKEGIWFGCGVEAAVGGGFALQVLQLGAELGDFVFVGRGSAAGELNVVLFPV